MVGLFDDGSAEDVAYDGDGCGVAGLFARGDM